MTTKFNAKDSVYSIASLGLLLAAGMAHAQSFSVDRFVLAGGGGTSSAAQFAITGTIGQPNAATASGGQFSLESGLWSVAVVIQTPGAPLLRVSRTGGNVVVAWDSGAAGFILEVTDQLQTLAAATNWQSVAATPVVANSELTVTLPAQPGARFFRLKRVGP